MPQHFLQLLDITIGKLLHLILLPTRIIFRDLMLLLPTLDLVVGLFSPRVRIEDRRAVAARLVGYADDEPEPPLGQVAT